MTRRWVTAPLRVTERVDYAVRSVLLLSQQEGVYLTAKEVAEHYGLSTKMLAGVLWNLRSAEILESRPGWHGGFRLARSPQAIPLSAVIAAAAGADDAPPRPRSAPLDCRSVRLPPGLRKRRLTWWTVSGSPWTTTSRSP